MAIRRIKLITSIYGVDFFLDRIDAQHSGALDISERSIS